MNSIKIYSRAGLIICKPNKGPIAIFEAGGNLTATNNSVFSDGVDITDTVQSKLVFSGVPYQRIFQEDGSSYGGSRSAVVTALTTLFATRDVDDFIVKDDSTGLTGTTKFRHKADSSGTADRDQGGTLELDTHSASIGLYESFLKINETDLSNTGGKTQAYGNFLLNLNNPSGTVNCMTINMGNVYQQAVGDFNFAVLDISGNVTFSSSTGTVTFSGDTSGIDYADLSNKPTLYTDASVDTHLNQSSASSGQYLKWDGSDYAWGTISSGGLGNVVEDTTPQLGGDLDVNGNKIISASNGDIIIDPNGTGAILLKSDDIKLEGAGTVTMSSLKFYEATALDGNYVALKAPLSITSDVTWELPGADGTANQVIKTNGSGVLSFTTVVSATNPVMQGTASFKAVASLPGAVKIFDVDDSHGVRLLAPSMTADLDLTLPATDGSAGQFLKTDGSGNLSFASAGGGGGNHFLGQAGGRWTWSSSDDGEVVALNSTYGYSYFNHSTEPDTSVRTYDATDTIDSTTGNCTGYILGITGFKLTTTDKKVKCSYSFRLQNAPTNSTWGISMWSGDQPASGNSGTATITLRGRTSDITQPSNSSSRVHHGSFTTTSAITEERLIFYVENRSGSLITNTYMYGTMKFELVD